MKKVSVIIPVYNAAKYIGRCLDSISKQSYKNLELLFVDDCGTDESITIIERFITNNQEYDAKILKHNFNRGVAAARNTALDAATGDYIYSIDADDYIDPNTITEMVMAAEGTGADIVGIEWMLTFEKNGRHMVQPDIKTGTEMFRKMCRGVMRWNLWLFMIRRSHIEDNQFRFKEGMNMGEDMMMMMKLSLSTQRVTIIHQPLYHYVNVSTSVSKVWSGSLIAQINSNVNEIEEYVDDNFKQEIAFLKLNQKLPLLISANQQDYETWTQWFPEANEYIFKNVELPLRTKLIQYAASKGHFWYVKLYYNFVVKFVYGIIFK